MLWSILPRENRVKYPIIILLRHGQTQWNVEERYQGQLNSNLTPLGKEQAKENALKIKKFFKLNTHCPIFSSPLGRAKETTAIICKELNIDINSVSFDKNIQEINYGIFEGKQKKFCQREYASAFEAREASKWSYKLEGGGESYEEVSKRLYKWLLSIKDESIVVVIAHEMINRTLRGMYLNYSPDLTLNLRQPNDMVLKLENYEESIVE
jgi:probable phosphoglycerate mutase